jgi:hypothetical protein
MTAKSRILALLDMAGCHYQLQGDTLRLETATLTFQRDALLVARQGKPERLMPYSRLNLDKLLAWVTERVARKSVLQS